MSPLTNLRHRDERGAIALEFMLTITILVMVFLLMLQYAVKAHAQQAAHAAAAQGLAAASSYDGTTSGGRATVQDLLHKLGPGLTHANISVTRTATTATVTITGDVEQLVPFLTTHVRVHLEGPVERFVPRDAGAAP